MWSNNNNLGYTNTNQAMYNSNLGFNNPNFNNFPNNPNQNFQTVNTAQLSQGSYDGPIVQNPNQCQNINPGLVNGPWQSQVYYNTEFTQNQLANQNFGNKPQAGIIQNSSENWRENPGNPNNVNGNYSNFNNNRTQNGRVRRGNNYRQRGGRQYNQNDGNSGSREYSQGSGPRGSIVNNQSAKIAATAVSEENEEYYEDQGNDEQ